MLLSLYVADKLRPDLPTDSGIQLRHDVATPPQSPKPVPQTVAQPLTPPQLSPREIKEEPLIVSKDCAVITSQALEESQRWEFSEIIVPTFTSFTATVFSEFPPH